MQQLIYVSPLQYFPVSRNAFEFKAGLRKIDVFSHERTEKIFQLDNQWQTYREAKLAARSEDFEKYVCEAQLNPNLAKNLAAFIVNQLCTDYPQFFSRYTKDRKRYFQSSLSEEMFVMSLDYELLEVIRGAQQTAYANLLDALICQLQEDVSLSEVSEGKDRISYLHLCLPNFWAAGDKIGNSFLSAHGPVPSMEKINHSAESLVKLMIEKGPFERFTWGITSDKHLNHHPANKQCDAGRDWANPQLPMYVRIERQITVPFTQHNAFLFAIRTYFRNIDSLSSEELARLVRSIETMPETVHGSLQVRLQ